MQENIEKQKAAVGKLATMDLPEIAGFEMLEGQMKLQKLNKEIVDGHNINIMDYGIIHKYQPLIDFCESINLAPTRPAAE